MGALPAVVGLLLNHLILVSGDGSHNGLHARATDQSSDPVLFAGCWDEANIPGWPTSSCTSGSANYYVNCSRLQGTHEQIVEQCRATCSALGYLWLLIQDTTACHCGAAANTASTPPNDMTGGCYNYLYRIHQAPTKCSEVADQTQNGWFNIIVDGHTVDTWCDFNTDPGKVWRVGLFLRQAASSGSLLPPQSREEWHASCSSMGYPDAGYGASSNVSWLVQKRMLYDSKHALVENGWPFGVSLAMPLWVSPAAHFLNIYDGAPAELPFNQDGNACDGYDTYCGYSGNVGWWTDDFDWPDPEGFEDYSGDEIYFSCLHLEKPAASIYVGPSTSSTKCVAAANMFCATDSGNQGKRLNNDEYGNSDTFAVHTAPNGSICVTSGQSYGEGWTMDLQLGCTHVASGQVLPSCVEAATNGQYIIQDPFGNTRLAYCDADHGGYELVMRMRSDNSVFTFSADHWTEATSYGDQSSAQLLWQDVDAKLGEAFNNVPAVSIRGCLGHWNGWGFPCVKYTLPSSASLLSFFRNYPETSGGLLLSSSDSSVPVGINLQSHETPGGRVRFGAFAFNASDSPLRIMGFGAGERPSCDPSVCPDDPGNNNVGAGWVRVGSYSTAMQGTIWIRDGYPDYTAGMTTTSTTAPGLSTYPMTTTTSTHSVMSSSVTTSLSTAPTTTTTSTHTVSKSSSSTSSSTDPTTATSTNTLTSSSTSTSLSVMTTTNTRTLSTASTTSTTSTTAIISLATSTTNTSTSSFSSSTNTPTSSSTTTPTATTATPTANTTTTPTATTSTASTTGTLTVTVTAAASTSTTTSATSRSGTTSATTTATTTAPATTTTTTGTGTTTTLSTVSTSRTSTASTTTGAAESSSPLPEDYTISTTSGSSTTTHLAMTSSTSTGIGALGSTAEPGASSTQTTSTTTTSTTTPPWVEAVFVRMTVTNVNYDQLMANDDLRDTFVQSVKEEVATGAGSGVGPENVQVTLSEGSVAVSAVVLPPTWVNASVLGWQMSETVTALAHSLVSQLSSITELSQVTTGSITIPRVETAVDLYQLPPPTQTTTRTSTATVTWAWNSSVNASTTVDDDHDANTSTSGTTTFTPSGETTIPFLPLAIGGASLLLLSLLLVWCRRKCRVVTEGRKRVDGVSVEYNINRPDCRQGTLLGRTVSLISRENSKQAPKTVISWHYDQEEVLRRHASFHVRPEDDVVLDIDSSSPTGLEDVASASEWSSTALSSSLREGSAVCLPRRWSLPEGLESAYPDGAVVEYFSQTHGKWAAGVVHRTRLTPGSPEILFDVRVGRQMRSQVTMGRLRPPLTEDMPVFACMESRWWCQEMPSPKSPTKRRGIDAKEVLSPTRSSRLYAEATDEDMASPARKQSTWSSKEVWRPARIHGQQKVHATRTGYRVRMEEDANPKNRDRIVPLAAHRLRRRFPPGCHVDVYRGPSEGWRPAMVQFCEAAAAEAAVRSVTSGWRLSSPTGGSRPVDSNLERFRTIQSTPNSFYAETEPEELADQLKDRDEEGQLVPICKLEDPRGEAEWLPGFLLRHGHGDSHGRGAPDRRVIASV